MKYIILPYLRTASYIGKQLNWNTKALISPDEVKFYIHTPQTQREVLPYVSRRSVFPLGKPPFSTVRQHSHTQEHVYTKILILFPLLPTDSTPLYKGRSQRWTMLLLPFNYLSFNHLTSRLSIQMFASLFLPSFCFTFIWLYIITRTCKYLLLDFML